MATTPNYGWVTPAPTDFVVDLPADFETFADAVDDTVKDLNPGTTAGDIDYYTSSTAKARLGIGTAGQVLAVNSGATAPEWISFGAGAYTLLASGSFPLTGTTLDLTSISNNYRDLVYVFRDVTCTLGSGLQISANNLGSNSYRNVKIQNVNGTTTTSSGSTALIELTETVAGTADNNFILTIKDYANTTTYKNATLEFTMINSSGNEVKTFIASSIETTSAISSIKIVAPGDTFGSGTYALYGVK